MIKEKMDTEEEIRASLFNIGKTILSLQNNFNALLPQYDKYFASAIKHSGHLDAYLATWMGLEKKTPLALSENQKKKIMQIVASTAEVSVATTKAIKEVLKKKESVFKLTEHVADCMRSISKTFPDAIKCRAEIEKLDGLYKNELNNYLQLKNELVVMTEKLDKAEKQLNEIKN